MAQCHVRALWRAILRYYKLDFSTLGFQTQQPTWVPWFTALPAFLVVPCARANPMVDDAEIDAGSCVVFWRGECIFRKLYLQSVHSDV
jgi:hypothetical protein